MKRVLKSMFLLCLCVLVLLVSLCGCEKNAESSAATTTTVDGVAEDTTTSASEKGSTVSSSENKTDSSATANATTSAATKASTTATPVATTTKAGEQKTTQTVFTTTTTKKSGTTETPITPLTALSPKDYYGYTLLKKEANGAALVEAYDRMVNSSESMKGTVDLSGLSRSLTKEEVIKVRDYYLLDYPQHFWVSGEGSVSMVNNEVVSITMKYTMSKTDRDAAKVKFDAAVNEILSKVSGSWSEYERELAVHDALCDRLTYQQADQQSFTAYGALINKKAVCEGYAESFQYLMYQCGIQCLGVVGVADGGPHKWNVIRIDGQHYHLDVTWDDPVVKAGSAPVIVHNYFNLPLSLLQRDHTVDNAQTYPLPACTSNKANYFKVTGGWMESLDESAVATALKKGNGKAELYFVNHTTQQFRDWFSGCWKNIFKAAGFGGKGYSMQFSDTGATITVK